MPKATDDVPWAGPPQFVVGLDIGTTHSSVTFSHLIPGEIPSNNRVTHWPGVTGEGRSGDAKTPSKLYYDRANNLKAVGATVNAPSTRYAAKNENWHLVRYFKLLMHPPTVAKHQAFHFEALPPGLSVERVYADMIRHMLDHTRDFYDRSNGRGKWREFSHTMVLVVAHPNGWGLREQERLRSAVVMSGVIDAAGVRRRVKFVPEAEAAVHYILWEKSQELRPGEEFIVCDAGGSTVDTTTYRVMREAEGEKSQNFNTPSTPTKRSSLGSRIFKKTFGTSKRASISELAPAPPKSPIHLKELKASDCQPAGGVFVNEAFITYLKDLLFPLPPDETHRLEQCVQKAEESFDANCKREFYLGRNAPSAYVVDMGAGISDYPDGNVVLDPNIVQSFFEDAVHRIIGSIGKQLDGTRSSCIYLVGGFGTSKYLRQQVERAFQPSGIQVLFLDDAHGKAASDGSIIWYIRQGVVGRAARMSFGLQIVERYDPALPEHQARTKITLPSGVLHVNGKWDLIVRKDDVVDEKWAIRRSYSRSYSSANPNLGHFNVELFGWIHPTLPPPTWVTDPDGNLIDGFQLIGEIEADLNGLRGSLQKRGGPHGDYWTVQFELCLEFGGVELTAYLEWKDRQIIMRSATKIVTT